jgi:hypothetical protein
VACCGVCIAVYRCILGKKSATRLRLRNNGPFDSCPGSNRSQLLRTSRSNPRRQGRMCNVEVLRFPTRPFSDDCFYSHDKILAHKVPTIVVKGCNLGLKVYATLTLDNVMIAQTLIPRNIAKDALAVHINPGFLKAENPPCSEVDATIVEIVANGDLLECQAQGSSGTGL